MPTQYTSTLLSMGIQPNLPQRGTKVRVHFRRRWYVHRTKIEGSKKQLAEDKVLDETFYLPTFGSCVAECTNAKTSMFADSASFDAIVTGYGGSGNVYGTDRFPIVYVELITRKIRV